MPPLPNTPLRALYRPYFGSLYGARKVCAIGLPDPFNSEAFLDECYFATGLVEADFLLYLSICDSAMEVLEAVVPSKIGLVELANALQPLFALLRVLPPAPSAKKLVSSVVIFVTSI